MQNTYSDDGNVAEHSRIYHRYRITNFSIPERYGYLHSIQQLAFDVVSPLEQEEMIQHLSSSEKRGNPLLQDKLRTAAREETKSLESILKPVQRKRFQDYQEFAARHEEKARRLVVSVLGTDLREFKQVYEFPVFRCPPPNSDIFMTNAPKSVSDSFWKRIALGASPQLDIWFSLVNLTGFVRAGDSVLHGVSIRHSNRPRLRSVTLNGPEVDQDRAYMEHINDGGIPVTVRKHFQIQNIEIKTLITNRAGIQIYSVKNVHKELELCETIYDQHIKPHVWADEKLIKPKRSR